MGTLLEDQCTFLIISHLVLRIRHVSAKFVVKSKSQILYTVMFFQCHVVYEVMWENIGEPDRPQMMHMYIACWITKATDTHLEYVILIAVLLQQWLHEYGLMLHLYVHCLPCWL